MMLEHIGLFVEGILLEAAVTPRFKMSAIAWADWEANWWGRARSARWEDWS